MSRMWFAKLQTKHMGGVLVPDDQAAQDFCERLGAGECFEAQAIRPRSVPWHRLYFGICRTIGQNQDPPRDADSIDAEVRVLAGHYNVLPLEGHAIEVRYPKRIAFDKLTGEEWSELWPKLEAAIAQRFGGEYVDAKNHEAGA